MAMPAEAARTDERLARYREALRCPVCRARLADEPGALRCLACSAHYPTLQGRPVLMVPATRGALGLTLETEAGRRMVAEYEQPATPAADEPARRAPRWLAWMRPPPIMHRYNPDLKAPPAATLFDRRDGIPRRILNVGGGPYRVTTDELVLNIAPFANVDLVADAHNIPLANDTLDGAFSLAVLEHVTDPQRVVAEMIRVLKPGGYLYSEVPFIWFFHGYPTDYNRFTLEGMKLLFAGLEDTQFGMTHGPVSAILQSANMVLELLMPKRPRLVRKLANGAFRWLFFPFKYLDIPLRHRPDAHILAGGFFVLGRKPGGG